MQTDPNPCAIPLGDILAYYAARNPGAPAITLGDCTLSHAALDARANRRARAIAAYGIGQGDMVIVALPNSLEFYETTFALWKLGAVPTIVSAKLPATEFGAIVALVDPKLVIGPDPHKAEGRTTLVGGGVPDGELSCEPLPSIVAPYWKAMSSGGSTGQPKIIVDHLPGLFDPAAPMLLQQVDDVILNPGPLYHNAPFIGTHWALFTGGHVIEMARFDAAEWLRLVALHKVGWVNLVPTMMNRIWRLPDDIRSNADLASLRVVFHMASACPEWLKQGWIDWLGAERIFELYGGTERQGNTIISGEEWLARRGSVGRIQPGSRLRILRADGSECDTGEIGEIYFLPDEGRNASYHYIGAQAKAIGEWESLGDLGRIDHDGYLFLSDRRTDLIVSGGANIYPAEVEAALDAHPAVRSSAVIGLPDDDMGQRVHAIVERDETLPLNDEQLLAFAVKRIARYKLPRSIEFVDYPLRDDAGKVRRSRLRELRS
jgi:bile acid-coenzyme A ligase